MSEQGGLDGSRTSKRERRETRRRRASLHARRRRFIRAGIVALVLLPAALWAFDLSGPEEIVEAQVLQTRFWRHRPANARPHNHTRAILIIEGLNEVNLDQADGLSRGQRVSVWIRRGRLSGYPYFQEVVSPEDLAAVEPPAEPAQAPEAADFADPQGLEDPNGEPLPEEEPEP
jgi:hypothetical protein